MNRPLLLLAVLALVFGLKGCTPDDCKPLYNITQPCWTVEYFIDGKDSTNMLRRTMPDSTNLMYALASFSCERGRMGNFLNLYYRKNDINYIIIDIDEKNNFFSVENMIPKNSIIIQDSTLFCNNNPSINPNSKYYYCKIDFQIQKNTSTQITFKGLKPYEKHLLVLTASTDSSCTNR